MVLTVSLSKPCNPQTGSSGALQRVAPSCHCTRLPGTWRTSVVHSKTHRSAVTRRADNDRFFDEGAAQVRKLLNRDRQEMLGLEEIGDNFRAEFEEEGASTPQTQDQEEAEFRSSLSQPGNNNSPTTNKPAQPRMNGAKPASPFGSTGSSSPFASSSPPKAAAPSAAGKSPPGRANPFGGSVAKKPFNEPVGLSPGMQPADMDEEPWWKKITVAQVVIVVSFTLIISLMLGTFALVYKVGGVRFNE